MINVGTTPVQTLGLLPLRTGGAMFDFSDPNLQRLRAAVSKERDGSKLMVLIDELNRLLEEQQSRERAQRNSDRRFA